VTVEVGKFCCGDANRGELVCQPELSQLTNGVWQDVDPYAEWFDRVGGLKDSDLVKSGGLQAQGSGQPADTTTDDQDFHVCCSHRSATT
jgi:hypothetical protein